MVNFDGISEHLALALPLHFSDRSVFLSSIDSLLTLDRPGRQCSHWPLRI